MIHEGQRSFRSQIAYVSLVAVLIVCALIIVVWNSPPAAGVFGALGVVLTAVSLWSGIEIRDDGVRVRRMLRTTNLAWADVDSFIVVGVAGASGSLMRAGADYLAANGDGPQAVGLSMDAIASELVAPRAPMFSAVAVVTGRGERLRVHGTSSTPLDPEFADQAAAELNRVLQQRRSAALTSAPDPGLLPATGV